MVADLLALASELDDRPNSSSLARASRSATSLGPVCDQDSVMKFGLYLSLYYTHLVLRTNKLCNFTSFIWLLFLVARCSERIIGKDLAQLPA